MIQGILIRFTCDMIQGIMNRIKLHETQETKAGRMIDNNQGYLNRIKHLETKSVATRKGNFLYTTTHLTTRNHITQ